MVTQLENYSHSQKKTRIIIFHTSKLDPYPIISVSMEKMFEFLFIYVLQGAVIGGWQHIIAVRCHDHSDHRRLYELIHCELYMNQNNSVSLRHNVKMNDRGRDMRGSNTHLFQGTLVGEKITFSTLRNRALIGRSPAVCNSVLLWNDLLSVLRTDFFF